MELDDYKTAWQEYDRKLEKNLRLNEELLRQMNLNHSRNEMRTPLIWEFINLFGGFLVIIFFVAITIRYYRETDILITGVISVISYTYYFWNAFIKIKVLTGIDYYNSSVIEIQKAILHFKQLYHKLKKIELLLSPVIMVTGLIMVFKGMHNINLIHRFWMLFGNTLICSAIAFPALLWIYKHCYEKKITKACEFLKNIEDFEAE